ncbi:MAG: tail fiber domain-containing protein, partial [Bacteroidota bacterium]
GQNTGDFNGASNDNIIIGNSSGFNSQGTDIEKNIIIGHENKNLVFGDDNILIGSQKGVIAAQNNNVVIGDSVEVPFFPFSDILAIDGNTPDNERPLLFGSFRNDWLEVNGKLAVNSSNSSVFPDSDFELIHVDDSSIGGLKIENADNGNYWRLYTRSFNGNLRFYSKAGETNSCGGSNNYVAWVDDCSGAWNAISDRRKKKAIEDIGLSLNKVIQLDVVKYQFNAEDAKAQKHIGLIAQDVLPYFPEAVHYDEQNDTYTMNYDAFGPIAIKAVQELAEEKEVLEKRVDTLEKELADLKMKVGELLSTNY